MSLGDIDYTRLPEGLRSGARLYVEHGVMPGDFLSAVLRNDLRTAVAHADPINAARLAEIVRFWSLEAPSFCSGSPERVSRWVDLRREQSRAEVGDGGPAADEVREASTPATPAAFFPSGARGLLGPLTVVERTRS